MKKVLCFLLAVMLLVGAIPISGLAAETEEKIEYLPDGSYIVERITVSGARASGSKTGSKTKKWYSSDGDLQWTATLTGTFTYNGSSATCTSASVSTSVSNSNWYTVSKSASKSGNTASASATMGRKVAGVTVEKQTVSLTLSCDKDGNLS